MISFLDLDYFRNLNLGEIWNFCKGPGLPWLGITLWSTKGLFYGLGALGTKGLEPNYYSILNQHYRYNSRLHRRCKYSHTYEFQLMVIFQYNSSFYEMGNFSRFCVRTAAKAWEWPLISIKCLG